MNEDLNRMTALLSTRQLWILVVDDEPDLQRNLEKTLVKEGYSIETAANSSAALRKLEQRSFDLIVLDVIMPDWTGKLSKRAGIDLLKEIRSKELNTPVVLLSANENIELVSEATLYGPVKYLVKGSISQQEFIKTVKQAINEDLRLSKELGKTPKTPQRWLINRFVSILDEIVTGIIVTGIMYFFGKATGNLEGKPLDWLSNATDYLVISGGVIILTIIIYIIWRRKSK